ncbi:MAG: hypothetical protein UY98_C0037G0001, partial [Candidatus Kaiserbacteria bacterium GW2011_GWA2_58_9]
MIRLRVMKKDFQKWHDKKEKIHTGR